MKTTIFTKGLLLGSAFIFLLGFNSCRGGAGGAAIDGGSDNPGDFSIVRQGQAWLPLDQVLAYYGTSYDFDNDNVDTSNVVYGNTYPAGIRGKTIDPSIQLGGVQITDDICSLATWIEYEAGGHAYGTLDIAVIWGQGPITIIKLAQGMAAYPAITGHLTRGGDGQDRVVIDVVFEVQVVGQPVRQIWHVRLRQYAEGNLNIFNPQPPHRVDCNKTNYYGQSLTPDVVYNAEWDRLDCVYTWLYGPDNDFYIYYSSSNGQSWTESVYPVSLDPDLWPQYPKLDIGRAAIFGGNPYVVGVVWTQNKSLTEQIPNVYLTGWESLADPDPSYEYSTGLYIPVPPGDAYIEQGSINPFIDISPPESQGTNLMHIVWSQATVSCFDVFYVNTHNIDDIIAGTDDWDYYNVGNDSYFETWAEVVAFADTSCTGKIVYISTEGCPGADGKIWTADFDFTDPSSVVINGQSSLPDPGNAPDKSSYWYSPSMSLCYPNTLRAAWPDKRTTFQRHKIYGNYFTP